MIMMAMITVNLREVRSLTDYFKIQKILIKFNFHLQYHHYCLHFLNLRRLTSLIRSIIIAVC